MRAWDNSLKLGAVDVKVGIDLGRQSAVVEVNSVE